MSFSEVVAIENLLEASWGCATQRKKRCGQRSEWGEGVNNGNEVGKSILSKPMEIFVCWVVSVAICHDELFILKN